MPPAPSQEDRKARIQSARAAELAEAQARLEVVERAFQTDTRPFVEALEQYKTAVCARVGKTAPDFATRVRHVTRDQTGLDPTEVGTGPLVPTEPAGATGASIAECHTVQQSDGMALAARVARCAYGPELDYAKKKPNKAAETSPPHAVGVGVQNCTETPPMAPTDRGHGPWALQGLMVSSTTALSVPPFTRSYCLLLPPGPRHLLLPRDALGTIFGTSGPDCSELRRK